MKEGLTMCALEYKQSQLCGHPSGSSHNSACGTTYPYQIMHFSDKRECFRPTVLDSRE